MTTDLLLENFLTYELLRARNLWLREENFLTANLLFETGPKISASFAGCLGQSSIPERKEPLNGSGG